LRLRFLFRVPLSCNLNAKQNYSTSSYRGKDCCFMALQELRLVGKQERKIWGFHGGDYEEWCLLGCYAVWLL
jgi:hypothetical protein